MTPEMVQEVLQMIEAEAHARPAPIEFEMAYQVRVAIDRIKFAIKHIEQFGPHTEQLREAGLQLVDALDRLQTAEHSFQKRFRRCPTSVDQCQAGSPDGKSRPGQRESASFGH
jgi:hypothetical protein